MFGLGEMNQGLSQDGTQLYRSSCDPKTSGKVISDELKNVRVVSSFSWTDKDVPTILVPGSPAVVRDVKLPMKVDKDSGPGFVDMNGTLLPKAPFAPLFAAVHHLEPDYDWPELDILTDRNALRKLMRWVSGKVDRDFRIDLELVGDKTVIFSRWEGKDGPRSSFGYGHNFEVAYSSSPGKKRPLGHHRVIEYEFGDLKVMMRFEVDACLPAPAKADLDDLTKVLGGLSLDKPASASAAIKSLSPLVQIIPTGELVPQDRMVEVTTRSQKSFDELNWGDPYPQIYLSHTPHLHVAVHKFGTFSVIHKYELGKGDLKKIHAGMKDDFRKLAVLLGIIVAKQRDAGPDERLTLVCQQGYLKVYENFGGMSCLPDDLLALFDDDDSAEN